MNIKVLIFMIIFMIFSIKGIASTEYDLSNYYSHGKEATVLAMKVSKLPKNYYLEYKSTEDLLETCSIISKYARYSNFDKYDIATIVLKESRFKKNAHNKTDGGRGLTQLTGINIWHKDTLFWITDPYDKEQNIKGSIILLEENFKRYKTKAKAVKHYNGSSYKAELYKRSFFKIKQELKAVQI